MRMTRSRGFEIASLVRVAAELRAFRGLQSEGLRAGDCPGPHGLEA